MAAATDRRRLSIAGLAFLACVALAAVFLFGLCHGLGLATKLQEYVNDADGLVANLVSFNVGVELGQIAALGLILIALVAWRTRPGFNRHAFAVNAALMCAGFVLAGNQLAGYVYA